MKLSLRSIYAVTILGALVFASCGPSKKDGSGEEPNDDQGPVSASQEIQDLASKLPPPTEIPYLLQATGAEFNQSLLNDRKKADSYLTRNDKAALNLGGYVADIGYLSSYDKTQEAIDHLNAVKMLADNLGILGTFDAAMLEQFEANISNKDSLASLIDQATKNTNKYLFNDERNKLAVMIITGSFVEGLSISTGLVKSYPKDLLPNDQRNLILTPIMLLILKQEDSVDTLIKLLGLVDQSEPVARILTDLTALKASYKELNIKEQIKNNKANQVLSDKSILEITRIVDKLRTFITE